MSGFTITQEGKYAAEKGALYPHGVASWCGTAFQVHAVAYRLLICNYLITQRVYDDIVTDGTLFAVAVMSKTTTYCNCK